MRSTSRSARWLAPLLAASLVVCSATPARADDDPPAPAPAPAAETSIEEQSRAHHRRGLELYDEGDYRLALVEFERAYAIGQNWKILYNIGQVHFQLTSYAKARRSLEQYLALGGDQIAAKRRADVEKDLETLKTRTATLTVRVSVPDSEIALNNEPLGKAPLENALVDAGTLHLQISHPGYTTRLRDVTLAGGDAQTVTIDLAESTPDVVVTQTSTGLPGKAIAGWIVTGVLAAGAIGTGIAANAASSTYDNKRNTPISGSPEEARSDLDRQRRLVATLAATTDVLAGLALVAGGVSLYFTLRDRPKPDAPRVRVNGTGATFVMGF